MAFVASRDRAAVELPAVFPDCVSLGSKPLILKWISQIR
jgi:hypothetical protein